MDQTVIMECRKWFRLLPAVAAGVLVTSSACAQTLDASPAHFSNQAAGLRVDRNMLAAPPADSPRVVLPESLPAATESYQMDLIGGGTVLLETARLTSDGRYVRPRLTIGNESAELKSWMKSAGLQAERCMLPMVRARLKRDDATGDVGSAFWVSARCKFY